jgi:Cdc6-like AAA superfamily ATPase
MAWFSRWFRRPEDDIDEPGTIVPVTVPTNASGKRVPTLPRFRGTAADRVRSGGSRLDLARLKLRNAFTPSRPVIDTSMFAGRTEVLRTLIRAIEDQQLHVIVFGSRGIGKTSTLHVLCSIAREARYVVHYDSCGANTTFDELFRTILRDLPLLYHEDYDPTADQIEEGLSFADLLDDTPLSVATLSDLFSKVSGTRLLIVLDEFDRAAAPAFRRATAELIKNLSDRASRVQLLIAGVAQNLNEVIEHIPSIRRNVLGLQLPNMTDDEVDELVTNGETVSGLQFSDDALDLIRGMVLGLPYLTSLMSQHAGLIALEDGRINVDTGDVQRALQQALEEIKLRIGPKPRHEVDRALADQRGGEFGLLARVALQNGGRLTPRSVEQAASLSQSASDYLRRLAEEYGLVTPIPDDPDRAYVFIDDGVAQYLWLQLSRSVVRPGKAG